ncbi:hypothetical protein DFR28_1039 [Arenicella xantha]|uniref:Lipoprotein n=1 Tax=Arenicella xantha TaxID=644221 RepID=A0A395JNC8_9GAMM|nr:hypothetical protein DFR28_1039 [Arenicella xantha]
MKNLLLVIFIVFITSGCATQKTYIGSVTSCQNEPVLSAAVEAWKNQLIPFHLPVKLGETKTDQDGAFVLSTKKAASFFVYSGEKLNFSTHPKKSINKCTKSNT